MVHADIVNGKYSIPSMETGSAKVAIATRLPATPGASPSGSTTPRRRPQAPMFRSPRYASAETSTLTYNVKSGSQKKDFLLTP